MKTGTNTPNPLLKPLPRSALSRQVHIPEARLSEDCVPGPPIRSNRVHLLPSPRVRTDFVATPHTVPVTPALRSTNCSNFFDSIEQSAHLLPAILPGPRVSEGLDLEHQTWRQSHAYMSPLILPCPWYKNGRSSRKVTALHWKADAVSFDQFAKPITPYP